MYLALVFLAYCNTVFAALYLFNAAEMFSLSYLSKHIHRHHNLPLNTKLPHLSIVYNFYILSFACTLVCLCVYTVCCMTVLLASTV